MINLLRNLLVPAAIILSIVSCSNNNDQASHTVGIINLTANLDPIVSAFTEDMALRGHKDGTNITYIYNGALKSPKEIDQEVLSMLAADVDLLITMTIPVTKKAQKMTASRNLPILFAPVFSPISSGVVDSMARPGANTTGIKVRGSTAKALEWFLKAAPSAKRIFVPFHHTDPAAIQTLEDLQMAATSLNVELITKNVTNEEEILKVLTDMPHDIDAVWLTHSHLIISNVEQIVARATALHKPVVSSTGQYTKGVMLCYAMAPEMVGKQASRMADKILTGTSPATMPVETADYFLGLNLMTAQAIGLKIPDDIISQADFIVR
jgi:putative ABC transport system substrate-binding protein